MRVNCCVFNAFDADGRVRRIDATEWLCWSKVGIVLEREVEEEANRRAMRINE